MLIISFKPGGSNNMCLVFFFGLSVMAYIGRQCAGHSGCNRVCIGSVLKGGVLWSVHCAQILVIRGAVVRACAGRFGTNAWM